MSLALACDLCETYYKGLTKLQSAKKKLAAPRGARGPGRGPARPGASAQRPRPLVMQDILFSTKFNVTTLRIPYASYTVASSEDMNENVQYSYSVRVYCERYGRRQSALPYHGSGESSVYLTNRLPGCGVLPREGARQGGVTEGGLEAGCGGAAVELRRYYGGCSSSKAWPSK